MRRIRRAPVSTPIFLADDLDVSAGFYERLGFRLDRLEPRYAIVVASGNEVLHLLVDRPWGMREFRVDDPSGNTRRVGTNLVTRGR